MDTQEKNTGQSFEEKTAQVRELIPTVEVDPLAIFCPVGVDFALMGHKYTIRPLPLKKLAMLERLGKGLLQLSGGRETDIDKVMMSIAETICLVVDAPKEDADFFFNNLTQPQLEWIFRTVAEMSQGISSKKG